MAQIAAYNFNEGSGTTAAEVGGGATLTSIPGWGTGLHGAGMELTNDVGPTATPFASSTVFTIMFDLYITDGGTSGWQYYVDAGFGSLQSNWTPELPAPGAQTIEWYPATGGFSVPLLEWHHVAMVATGSQHQIFVDGVQVSWGPNTTLSGTGTVQFGGQGAGNAGNFIMDNLRIFDSALTEAEIAELAGTEAVVPPLEVDIADAVGITDSMDAHSDNMLAEISDSLIITDTGAPQALEITEAFGDSVALTDIAGLPPTAAAGSDQLVAPSVEVTLTGSGSDPDGTIAAYTWTQVSGPAATLAGSGASRTFTPTVEGTYVFGLTVTDDAGLVSSQDTVTVTVASVETQLINAGYVPYIIVQL